MSPASPNRRSFYAVFADRVGSRSGCHGARTGCGALENAAQNCDAPQHAVRDVPRCVVPRCNMGHCVTRLDFRRAMTGLRKFQGS